MIVNLILFLYVLVTFAAFIGWIKGRVELKSIFTWPYLAFVCLMVYLTDPDFAKASWDDESGG